MSSAWCWPGMSTPFGRSVREAVLALNSGRAVRESWAAATGHRRGGRRPWPSGARCPRPSSSTTPITRSIVHMSKTRPSPAPSRWARPSRTRRPRPHHRDRHRQRDLLPHRQRGARTIPPAGLPSHGGSSPPSSATFLAAKLLGLSVPQMTNAAGIAGSFASGLLECWVDGTQTKFLHPGWSAQSGIAAADSGAVRAPPARRRSWRGASDSSLPISRTAR